MSRRISFTPSLESARFLDKLAQEATEELGRPIGVGEILNAILWAKRVEVERTDPTDAAVSLTESGVEVGLPGDLRTATLRALTELH